MAKKVSRLSPLRLCTVYLRKEEEVSSVWHKKETVTSHHTHTQHQQRECSFIVFSIPFLSLVKKRQKFLSRLFEMRIIKKNKTSLVLFFFWSLLWQWWPSSSPNIASQGNNNQITFLLFVAVRVIEYFQNIQIKRSCSQQERRTQIASSGSVNIISFGCCFFFYCLLLNKRQRKTTTTTMFVVLYYLRDCVVSVSLLLKKVYIFSLDSI